MCKFEIVFDLGTHWVSRDYVPARVKTVFKLWETGATHSKLKGTYALEDLASSANRAVDRCIELHRNSK